MTKPTITKERIIARNGKLEYLPFDYSKPGTDVRLLVLPKGQAAYKLVARPGAKVSVLDTSTVLTARQLSGIIWPPRVARWRLAS